MKRVFNTGEVPHLWANQLQVEGRNSQGNFYFEGATIYSYGKHFPIATIEGETVLFTLGSYSNTTAKHIREARAAVSHKNIIYCYEVPVKYWGDKKPLNKQSFTLEHSKNFDQWKRNIKGLFAELGNKRIRDTQARINAIGREIHQLTEYAQYFGIKINDKELKDLIKLANAPDFVEQAREAAAKKTELEARKLKQAAKAYSQYLTLWRDYDAEGLKNLPEKVKDLANYHNSRQNAFTRLRFNKDKNRVETSKGIEIPAPIAQKAYKQLNGCMEGTCKDISVPVMDYTITETGEDYIKAGCHTIPKEDVRYIASLLNW
jgi:hypothetical protein